MTILETIKSLFDVLTTLRGFNLISAIFEIIVLAFLIYKVLEWVKDTRSWTLLKGTIVVVVFIVICNVLQFKVLIKLMSGLFGYLAIIVVVLFQQDIRDALERIGRRKIFNSIIPNLNKLKKRISDNTVQEIVAAVFAMSKVKTGALIVIERNESLLEIEKTGITIDATVSRQLIVNIFEKNTPLHDGALLVVGNHIKAATCYLPLSHNMTISKSLGTRHRAALGISETSDSITIVVSEETGTVSVCYDGNIKEIESENELTMVLIKTVYQENNEYEKSKV